MSNLISRRSPKPFAYLAAAAAALTLCIAQPASAAVLTPVVITGTNPGNLSMYKYVPAGMPINAPVVVLLHGCTQTAASYDDETGWVKYADLHKFYLVFAEQKLANNANGCFNWFEPGDQTRGSGEALSINQMVDTMKSAHSVDASRIFVSGLSAGGAMAAVMLATYPDVFKAGAVNSGVAYKCATNALSALTCMAGATFRTPAQWGDLARSGYVGYPGVKPDLIVFQGTADTTVTPVNQSQLMQQWTNYRGVSQIPTLVDTVRGYPRSNYNSKVMTVSITGMGHGVAIAPGVVGADQCGTVAPYVLNAGICSTYYTGKFWSLF